MKLEIQKAAVLGAGTMGSRIAAHLANAGVDVVLLDIPTPGAETEQQRNAIVAKAFKALKKSRVPAFFTGETSRRIRLGNFQDNLDQIADADWIIEAVIERLDVKQQLLEKVDSVRRPGSLVSSNTSGLPIAKLAEGRSDDFRAHWLGTHFFNPPRHMRLVELIPTPETTPDVLAFLGEFCDRRLGKVVVEAKDRPNFIANRIFLFSMMQTLQAMARHGLSVEEVDALTGPLIGRPRMATFRLADFTGIDICVYVAKTIHELVPDDERRDVYVPPDYLLKMVEQGMLGDKARQGFYKRDRKAPGGRLALDLESLQYREMLKPSWPSVDRAKGISDIGERLRTLFAADDVAGKFLWDALSDLFLYAAARVPEVCDDIVSVDTTMRSGFNWQQGIFEMWNAVGVEETSERMKSEGKALPPLVERVLASESKSFYGGDAASPTYFDLASRQSHPVPPRPGVLDLSRAKAVQAAVRSNPSASLWDLGGGVALLEFHSKANSLDADVFEMMESAIDETEKNFGALLIGNDADRFSAGANLKMILGLSLSGRWDEIDLRIAEIQQLILRLRSCKKPTVAAVQGQTLAGGCEVALRCDHVQAAAETYMGLVEVGAGLIPAGGGCAEMLRRHTDGRSIGADLTQPTRAVFQRIATAKVSNSAAEARQWRYVSSENGITMNRDRLLAEAKQAAVALAASAYEPPEPTEILVGGRGVRAALELGAWMMRQAEWASDYDVFIAKKLAHVLAGGDLTQASYVSEDYLIGLEREAFLSLCGEKRSQQRMEHILKKGKPLRN